MGSLVGLKKSIDLPHDLTTCFSQHPTKLLHSSTNFVTSSPNSFTQHIHSVNMVHLATVPNDDAAKAPLVDGLEHIKLEGPTQDEINASVYGSRFANQDLPSHDMPDGDMPRDVAYRMIKDHLTLDGNPVLNLARCV